ncbi:MAG: hypothetical protein KAY59_11040, partial [Acidobacteria bacterium]|nr:hypothetical protein [Acidobacteriota bacterium]
MKRLPWIIVAVVVLVVLVAVLWWRRMSPAGVATPPSSAAAAVARPQLRLSLQIEVADPGVEALATVKVFDPQAVQREAFQAAETANGREVRNSARARV